MQNASSFRYVDKTIAPARVKLQTSGVHQRDFPLKLTPPVIGIFTIPPMSARTETQLETTSRYRDSMVMLEC